ncbi:hypothetical protein C8J57DRAFT_1249710 [Mycena rebaudengoi]|nr:hypothetical protein C8J57DRAFT_1249710 [Mycena rebaudengoi]
MPWSFLSASAVVFDDKGAVSASRFIAFFGPYLVETWRLANLYLPNPSKVRSGATVGSRIWVKRVRCDGSNVSEHVVPCGRQPRYGQGSSHVPMAKPGATLGVMKSEWRRPARVVAHGVAQKAVFDCRVLESSTGEVVYKPGDLVQVLDPQFKKTFLLTKKFLPTWSGALRVKTRLLSSYTIETIYGEELDGRYSARRLRPIKPPKGSSLEAYEKALVEGSTEGVEVGAQQVGADVDGKMAEGGSTGEVGDRAEEDGADENGRGIGQRIREIRRS